jgi:hypothetical protein
MAEESAIGGQAPVAMGAGWAWELTPTKRQGGDGTATERRGYNYGKRSACPTKRTAVGARGYPSTSLRVNRGGSGIPGAGVKIRFDMPQRGDIR